LAVSRDWLKRYPWVNAVSDNQLQAVCALMQSRVKRFADLEQWSYFFVDVPEYDEKVCVKQLKDPAVRAALQAISALFAALPDFAAAGIESAIQAACDQAGLAHGKLNQPLRAAVTGSGVGAGIYETVELLGRERSLARLKIALERY